MAAQTKSYRQKKHGSNCIILRKIFRYTIQCLYTLDMFLYCRIIGHTTIILWTSIVIRIKENMATTLHSFLASHSPEYIDVVPWHWLEQDLPRVDVQIYASVVFLLICIPGNVGQILVITAYCRYVWFKTIVYYTWII